MARKKTEKVSTRAAAETARGSSLSSETISNDQKMSSMKDSLERARDAVETGQRYTLSLHRSWRSQLQRVSLLVLVIVLKQASIPVSECREKINEWNEQTILQKAYGDDSNKNTSLLITQWEMGKYCIADSLMEISSVLCCLSFIWLTSQPLQGNDFSSLPFRLSVFFVPLIVASYYYNPMVGCALDIDRDHNDGFENESEATENPRSFPVVLILLLVGFASLYMMENQQRQQSDNVQKVQKLSQDLLAMSEGKKQN